MSERRALAIGEVIDLLQEEFPDVSISKLRFLESQGLIRPVRSPSGYRQFRAPDVERIRYILRQQRDHFLPLKVIKAKLSAWERGEEPTVSPAAGPLPEAYFGGGKARMSADELARAAGVPLDLVQPPARARGARPAAGAAAASRSSARTTPPWPAPPSAWSPGAWSRAT